jgi:hypothetical protein
VAGLQQCAAVTCGEGISNYWPEDRCSKVLAFESLFSRNIELLLEICAGIDVTRRKKKKIVKINTATSDEIIAFCQILEIKYKQAVKLTDN